VRKQLLVLRVLGEFQEHVAAVAMARVVGHEAAVHEQREQLQQLRPREDPRGRYELVDFRLRAPFGVLEDLAHVFDVHAVSP
jgi:hypothetical protein